MLNKIGYVADYEGRSVNSHVLVLIRENIKKFEEEHGSIDGDINPDVKLNRLVNKDFMQLLVWRLHHFFILGSSLGHRSIRVAS